MPCLTACYDLSDMQCIDALADAIQNFKGGVVLVRFLWNIIDGRARRLSGRTVGRLKFKADVASLRQFDGRVFDSLALSVKLMVICGFMRAVLLRTLLTLIIQKHLVKGPF